MITRIWHGWTTHKDADAYEKLLCSRILPRLADLQIKGYEGAHLLRRDSQEGVEFITLLWFDTFNAVQVFARETAGLPGAQPLLLRSDPHSHHYRVIAPDSSS